MIRFVEAALFAYALWLAIFVGLHIAELTKSTFASVAYRIEATTSPHR
jgi:hypothetical protein